MARADTPLADRFAAALAGTEPSRFRIGLDAYVAAFVETEPALANSAERRDRIASAIAELADAGVLVASRSMDRTERPPLPKFVVMLDRTRDPPVGSESAAYPWRPELAWAARLPLRRSEFEALQRIQAFVRDRGLQTPVIPTGERSLQLFGDEKRLDVLRRNRRLFTPGRLSLELLGARAFAPPFVYRRVGDGPVALVLENVATFRSVLAALPAESPVGLVVFGAGGNFAASVAYFSELATEGPASTIRELRYFGDLDRRGLEIPVAADRAAREAGLPPVFPALELWSMLLEHGHPAAQEAVDAAVAAQLVTWLPAPLRNDARAVLVRGTRLAQEVVGVERLVSNGHWASWEGLGPAARPESHFAMPGPP